MCRLVHLTSDRHRIASNQEGHAGMQGKGIAGQAATRSVKARWERICVPVTGDTPERLLARSAALIADFPFQELRLDYLEHPSAILAVLRPYMDSHPQATFLATCRTVSSGGHFTGTPKDELLILQKAAEAGCALVDLSLESAEALPPGAVQHLQASGAAVIISWHDFARTGDLSAVLKRMRPFQPDLYKIVPTAETLADNLALLGLFAQRPHDEAAIVGLCMGEAGVPSRVLGVRMGSPFTFAAASAAEATAPGQLDAHTLRDLYGLAQLTPATRIYGVAGDPVRSSMSPAMLNPAFRRHGVDAVYVPLLTHNAAELFAMARALPLEGFSVTMPLKQAVIPFLDFIDPLARKIGAVNTVRREPDGSFLGFNTDVSGIVAPLEERMALHKSRVLVLGAGGAARAAVFACWDRGAQVTILNRTFETASSLAQDAGARAIQREELATEPLFDAIINATPAGMRGNDAILPAPLEEMRAGVIFDMVYNPQNTPLLEAARAAGLVTIPGIEMFVRQGAQQLQLWTGQQPDIAAMRADAIAKLEVSARPSPPARSTPA